MMRHQKLLVLMGIGLFALIVIIYQSAFVVYPHMQVLVLEFGEAKRVIQDPGLHFKIPFVESLVTYEKRILSLDVPPEEIITADKNRMVVDTYSRYRIRDPLMFYQKAGNEERAAQLLTAQISPALRKTLGQVNFEDVLASKRNEIMRTVQQEAMRSAKDLGIDVIDVRIRRADVPKQNSDSIFRRMKSERERFAKELRAKGKEKGQAIRADADRQATVIIATAHKTSEILKGEGDSKASHIYGEAYSKNQEFYKFYRALEAYETSLLGGEKQMTMVIDPKDSAFFSYM